MTYKGTVCRSRIINSSLVTVKFNFSRNKFKHLRVMLALLGLSAELWITKDGLGYKLTHTDMMFFKCEELER